MESQPGKPRDRLESWKEIAAYLRRGERTVRRWEASEGLPVRRIVHRGGASVYALAAELDAWRQRRNGPATAVPPRGRLRPRWTTAIAVALLAAFAVWWLNPLPPPRLLAIGPITRSGHLDYLARLVTDGNRVYYLERAGDHWNARIAWLPGGSPPAPLRVAFPGAAAADRNVRVFDIAPDGRRLIGTFRERGAIMPLWTLPALGGAPLRVGAIASNEAVFDAHGRGILYAQGRALWTADANGGNARLWARLPGLPTWMAWSPDRRRLRLTLIELSQARARIWEISASGAGLHPLLPAWGPPAGECCGAWTADGRYYLFTSAEGEVWARRERSSWRRARRGPFPLTFGPTQFTGVVTGGEPPRAAFFGAVGSEEMNLWDPGAQRAAPFLPALHPGYVSYSADGARLITLDRRDQSVWLSGPDGGHRAQLTRAPPASFPRIAPRGDRVAFVAQPAGVTNRVYLIPTAGGTPRDLLPAAADVHDPDWSPDGKRIVLVHAASPAQVDDATDALYVVAVDSGAEIRLAGSAGLFAPRWSPADRWIAAVLYTQREMRVYDRRARTWRAIARGTAFGMPAWSHDGGSLYYQDLLAPGEPIYRWQAADGKVEKVADFGAVLRAGIDRCGFVGLTPEDRLLVNFNRGSNDLFAGQLILP